MCLSIGYKAKLSKSRLKVKAKGLRHVERRLNEIATSNRNDNQNWPASLGQM